MAGAKVFGLGGVSCGGKSTLSGLIRCQIGSAECITFNQDDYYWPEDHCYWKNDGTDNWDVITAFDMEKMISDVRAAVSSGVSIIIVEGIMIYDDRRLDQLIDYKYFITLPFDICKSRRVLRNYQPPEPYDTYFEDVYWPVYLAQLEEAKKRSDLTFVDSSQALSALEEFMSREIRERMK